MTPFRNSIFVALLASCTFVAQQCLAFSAHGSGSASSTARLFSIAAGADAQEDDDVPDVPNDLRCPLLMAPDDVMENPVVTADGHTYEETEIARWLESHDTSPKTNLPLANKTLIPNHLAREYCRQWPAKLEELRSAKELIADMVLQNAELSRELKIARARSEENLEKLEYFRSSLLLWLLRPSIFFLEQPLRRCVARLCTRRRGGRVTGASGGTEAVERNPVRRHRRRRCRGSGCAAKIVTAALEYAIFRYRFRIVAKQQCGCHCACFFLFQPGFC